MYKSTLAATALLVSTAIAGCSSDDDDDAELGGPPSDEARASALDGEWTGECLPNPTTGFHDFREYAVDGEAYEVGILVFGDDLCENQILQFDLEGVLSVDEDAPADGGVRGEVDMTVEFVQGTPTNAEGADFLNATAFCDRADYAVGASVEFESCSTLGFDSVPYMHYDSYLVEGDTLYVGPELADTPEERAPEVDFTDPYTRQR